MFSRRIIEPELLDRATPDEARLNLADLVRINRTFGGHTVIRKMLAGIVRRNDRFTLLDIGAASGDTARMIRDVYPFASVTSLDQSPVNLGEAPHPKLIGNAFALPFSSASFDYVLCSLFLHHFTDTQVEILLRSFYAIAGRALMVCDLERNVIPYLFLPATKRLFRWQRITVHDGRVSVRASFRRNELLALTKRAGIECASVSRHRPAFRLSMVALKPPDVSAQIEQAQAR